MPDARGARSSPSFAAACAALFAVLAGAVARYAIGGHSGPEHLFNVVVALTPGVLESKAIAAFSSAAKPALFAACVVAIAFAYAVLPRFASRWSAASGGTAPGGGAAWSWPRLAAFATVGGAALILTSNWLARTGGPDSMARSLVGLVVANGAYLVALAALTISTRVAVATPIPTPDGPASSGDGAASSSPMMTRRAALVRAGRVSFVAASMGMGAWLWRRATRTAAVARRAGPLRPPAPAEGVFSRAALLPIVDGEITPTGVFYRVSKNAIDPEPSAADWFLRIEGLVERPMTVRASDVESRRAEDRYHTLMCISNEIGDSYIGNATWSGFRLIDLLREAGVAAEARYVNFLSADGYVESISMAQAEQTLLATHMNGAVLEARHGFPLRALVPGTYGKKNPKWITRIAPSRDADVGFWKRLGWDSAAKVQTFTRIDTPRNRSELSRGEIPLGGVAFASDRGIRAVEWSADGGRTWQAAALRPALSPDSWVVWAAVWTPPAAGAYRIAARAIDGDGEVQTDRTRPAFPAGVTGHHVVDVDVRD